MVTKDMFDDSPESSSPTPAAAALEPKPDARIGEHGRMTTCCGACSTIDQDTGVLYCKKCYQPVPEGEGDGGGRVTIEIGDHANLADAGDTASGLMHGERLSLAHIPEFTLKNVKHAAFNSKDSECFEATVYADGHRYCTASDDGWGGSINFHPINGSGIKQNNLYASIASLDEALKQRDGFKTHNRNDGTTFTMANTQFEFIVSGLLTDWLYAKDLKKLMAKRVVYALDGKIMQTNRARTKAQLQIWIDSAQPDEGIVLNKLAFDAALKLYRESMTKPQPEE